MSLLQKLDEGTSVTAVRSRKISNFEANLKELPKNLRTFSLILRALYSDEEVSSSSVTGKKINKLRDMTRKDALVYVNAVLPFSTQVIRSIKEFFEYYVELNQQEWKESLRDIFEEVKGYRQCCNEVVNMHESIMTPLKARQDQALVLVNELGTLNQDFLRKKELEDSAQDNKEWATILFFVPVVNLIACPLLNMSVEKDLAKAVAAKQQIDINDLSVVIVKDALIPALSALLDGLSAVAGFFEVMENELASFLGKEHIAMQNARSLHYTMMNKKAGEIKRSCTEFYAVMPDVRTDLLCIPNKPGDQNYVDKWLSATQKEIEKKYAKGITNQLRTMMIKYFAAGGKGKHMGEDEYYGM